MHSASATSRGRDQRDDRRIEIIQVGKGREFANLAGQAAAERRIAVYIPEQSFVAHH